MKRALVISFALLSLTSCTMPPTVLGNQPLSQGDIREIKQLVLQRPDIKKPILRIFFDRADHAWVNTGQDGYVGAVGDQFTVAKRHGRWEIDSKIEEETILVTAD
jgi:hypothetical protein